MFAHRLIDGRLQQDRRDGLPLAVTLPVIGNEGSVGPDVAFEGSDRLEQLVVLGAAVFDVQSVGWCIEELQGPIDLAVPQVSRFRCSSISCKSALRSG
jgi:hypothetical protein